MAKKGQWARVKDECEICGKKAYSRAECAFTYACSDCWCCPDCNGFMEKIEGLSIDTLWICDNCGHIRTEIGLLKKLQDAKKSKK
jgi:hypothetical protein